MSADAVNHAANANSRAVRDASGLHPGRPRLPARLRHVGRTADLPAPFPCLLLCSECGYLRDPPPPGTYRSDGARVFAEPCPACKATVWIDLQRAEIPAILAESDEMGADRRESALRRWSGWAIVNLSVLAAGSGIIAGGTYILYRFLRDGFATPAVITFLAVIMAILVVARRAASALKLPVAPERPARWRLPLPLSQLPRLPPNAAPKPASALLTAPISGRPCIAYEVGVREDDTFDAHPGSWLLLDQRVVALEVGEQTLPPDTATLDLADRRTLAPDDDDDSAERLLRFLRERGFTGHEPILVYETIIPPDTPLHLEPTPTTLRLHPQKALPTPQP